MNKMFTLTGVTPLI